MNTTENNGTVLIVDDNKNNISILTLILKYKNYKGIGSNSGEHAIQLLEEIEPDLILMDIMMPVMNGFETCKRIKKNPKTAHIPIIFLSALDDKEAKLEGFAVGGQDYITKPFQQEETLARVETHIRLKKLQDEQQKHAKEMEEFAYMAAHDLRSPTGTIEGFCNILKEDKILTGEYEKYLDHISNASESLRTLVDSLLLLADVNNSEFLIKEINLKAIFDEIKQDYTEELGQLGAKLIIPENLSPIKGDVALLKILFKNLISNSIKYRKTDIPLEIIVREFSLEDHSIIEVKDNGRGFDSESAGDIFKSFKRLPHTANIGGHGIGLSICKKIITRHNGYISANSQEDEGCLITVKLHK
jgi:signal transduction histidine kinase